MRIVQRFAVDACTGLETEHATLAVRGQQGLFDLGKLGRIEQGRALLVVGVISGVSTWRQGEASR